MASSNVCRELCTSLHQDVLDKSIEIVHNPGPGTYNHQGSVGMQPLSTSATSARAVIGTQKREEKPEITTLEHAPPGPGRYDFNNSVGANQNASQRQNFPSYSFGLRHKPDDPTWKHAPGPQYDAINSVGKQVSSTKVTAPIQRFGKEARVTPSTLRTDSKKSPGPIYLPTSRASAGTGVRSLVSGKKSAPSFGFGRASRTTEPNPWIETPGPGAYNHAVSTGKQANTYNRTTASAVFSRAKRDRRKVEVGAPGPVGNRNSAIGKQPESARNTAPSYTFGGR